MDLFSLLSPLLTIIKDYLAVPVSEHISHALHVKTKLQNLRDELSDLEDIAVDVGRKVNLARARHQILLSHVLTWQKKMKSLRQEIDGYLVTELKSARVLCKGLPNLSSRYKVGKRATENLITVKKYKEEGNKIVTVSVVLDPDQPSPAEAVNAAALEEELKHLSSLELHMNSIVENAKIDYKFQTNRQVEDWFLTVAKNKVDAKMICEICQQLITEKADLESNSWVRVDLHRILEKRRDLIKEGKRLVNDNNFLDSTRPFVVVQQSIKLAVGQEKAYAEVMKLIEDDDVKLIGIYGMGGVGKTTLFNRINNSLDGIGYDIVIFVVISKDASTEGVQGDIMKRLGINIAQGTSKVDERRNMIRSRLTHKKFVLMLDDVWMELNLNEVGIPMDGNRKNYKILFTTRDERVCDHMNANKVKIECLNDGEAWNLFETTVGKQLLNSSTIIKNLGEQVAKECGGLPSALIVNGEAMRGKTTVSEWKNALSTLRQIEPELTGTLELYNPLKFSYTNLANDVVKECFCYCALFPKDWVIKTDSLVDCWIGEGFFEDEIIDNSRNKGYTIIADLIRACLLEDVEDDFSSKYQWVKMHVVVRDMVLWIKKDEFVVFTSGTKSLKLDMWGKVKRLGITTDQGLEKFLENRPEFINLSTLLIINTCMTKLRDDFFLSMSTCLDVLHIYGSTYIHKTRQMSLDPLRRITRLRYFSTETLLPTKEFGTQLGLEILKVKLEFEISVMSSILEISALRLPQMRVLHLCFDDYKFEHDLGVKVADLEGLKNLEDLILPISTLSFLRELAASPKLAHCVSGLLIRTKDMKSCRLSLELGRMDRLEHITFEMCKWLQEIVIGEETAPSRSLQNLKSIHLRRCDDLQTLYCYETMPQLEHIAVSGCSSLCVLFTSRDGSAPYVFPELRRIDIRSASVLEYICNDAFSFPRLETLGLNYFSYQNLKNLPKGIIQAKKEHLKKIKSNKSSWEY